MNSLLKWYGLHRSDQFKQRRGDLTSHEREQVIAQIESGRARSAIAADWLLSESRVHHIAMEHRRGTNSRGRMTPQNLAREGEGEAVVRAPTNPPDISREPEQ